MFKTNIGPIDRAVRVLAGLTILAIGFWYGSLWGLVGVIPLATGSVGFCPAYCPLGISTCAVKPPAAK